LSIIHHHHCCFCYYASTGFSLEDWDVSEEFSAFSTTSETASCDLPEAFFYFEVLLFLPFFFLEGF